MRYQDKAVLVTGGGSGIGEQVCLAAAREGARVAIGDRDRESAERTAATIRATGAEAHAFALDVADPASVNDFIAGAETTLGRLDVLVNSAGVREIVSVLDLSFEEWQRVIAINLSGTFLARSVTRRMSRAGSVVAHPDLELLAQDHGVGLAEKAVELDPAMLSEELLLRLAHRAGDHLGCTARHECLL